MNDIEELLSSQRVVEKFWLNPEQLQKHFDGDNHSTELLLQKMHSTPGDILLCWPTSTEMYYKLRDCLSLFHTNLAQLGVRVVLLPPDVSQQDVVIRTVIAEDLISILQKEETC